MFSWCEWAQVPLAQWSYASLPAKPVDVSWWSWLYISACVLVWFVLVVCFIIEKPDCSSSSFLVAELVLEENFSLEDEKHTQNLFAISCLCVEFYQPLGHVRVPRMTVISRMMVIAKKWRFRSDDFPWKWSDSDWLHANMILLIFSFHDFSFCISRLVSLNWTVFLMFQWNLVSKLNAYLSLSDKCIRGLLQCLCTILKVKRFQRW